MIKMRCDRCGVEITNSTGHWVVRLQNLHTGKDMGLFEKSIFLCGKCKEESFTEIKNHEKE